MDIQLISRVNSIKNGNNVAFKEEIMDCIPGIIKVEEFCTNVIGNQTIYTIKDEESVKVKEEPKDVNLLQELNDLQFAIKNEGLDIKHENER